MSDSIDPVSSPPRALACAEIWGGNAATAQEITTPGVSAAMHSSACGDARGGDLYYFSVCSYYTLTRIAIADVRGHGEAVQDLSRWLYDSLAFRMNDRDGARVLADLNEMVIRKSFDAITTAVVATFDRDRSALHFAYAGHPPILIHRSTMTWEPLETSRTVGPANLPLGVIPNARYTQEKVRIEPGDRVFLYTDGVSEGLGQNEEPYGDGEMMKTLEQVAEFPVRDARDAVLRNLTAYCGGALLHDDCTFMVVEPFQPVPIWQRMLRAR